MVEEPERYVPRFVLAGADIVTIHVEASKDVLGTLKAIRIHGARAGLALRQKTPLLSVQAALPLADVVLVPSADPGSEEQPFPEAGAGARAADPRMARRLEVQRRIGSGGGNYGRQRGRGGGGGSRRSGRRGFDF